MKLSKLSLFLLLMIAIAFTACVPEDEESAAGDDAYRKVLPLPASLSIEVPSNDGSGALALGDTSELYTMTRNISSGVNVHVGAILLQTAFIAGLPATTTGDNFRVWGPIEPEGLEKLTWRLTITKITDDRYSFEYEARAKGLTEESDFHTTLVGEVTPSEDPLKSEGSMTLDFDGHKIADPELCEEGKVHIAWDSTTDTREVKVNWENFANTCNGESSPNSEYTFHQNKDAGGDFEFIHTGNIHDPSENKPGLEVIAVNTRWVGGGAGRSDVIISGEEVAADFAALGLTQTEVNASQCWDELFGMTYSGVDPEELAPYLYGAFGEESSCPFSSAEMPTIVVQ